MTTEQPSFGPRWIVACIECLYACAYDVAARSTRRQWHPAGRAVFWLLASEAMRLAAVRATLMRVPTVPLDVERLERPGSVVGFDVPDVAAEAHPSAGGLQLVLWEERRSVQTPHQIGQQKFAGG